MDDKQILISVSELLGCMYEKHMIKYKESNLVSYNIFFTIPDTCVCYK